MDDFAPSGSPFDQARVHAVAERVIRGAGNASSRGRMSADGRNRPDLPPRGVLLMTGEDIPKGHSIRARLVVIEVERGDVDLAKLSAFQLDPGRSAPSLAMAGYVQWLAGRMTEIRRDLSSTLISLRSHVNGGGQHARTPDAIANMALGWHYWLRFACDLTILSRREAEAMYDRVWQALIGTASEQSSHLAGEDPAPRFLELLRSVLARGEAYVCRPDGSVPSRPTAWGWRLYTVGTGAYERDEWRPQGHAVGWIEGDDLFLDPTSAYAAIQKLGAYAGGGIAISPRTVHKRLNQAKLLKTTGLDTRKTLTIRRTIGEKRVEVLHLSASTVMPEEIDQYDHSDQDQRSDSNQGGDFTTDDVPDGAKATDREDCNGAKGQFGQLTMNPSDRVTCRGCGERIVPRSGKEVCDSCRKRQKSAA